MPEELRTRVSVRELLWQFDGFYRHNISPLADPGSNPVMVMGLAPPQPPKNCAWTNGHRAIHNTHQANIHVGLLNLLSPDVISEVQNGHKCVGGRPPRTQLGAYSAPQTLGGLTAQLMLTNPRNTFRGQLKVTDHATIRCVWFPISVL